MANPGMYTALTLLILVSCCRCSMWEWGPDLEGPWCAKRPFGEQCCDDRNDDCSVPILGTECYCDVFCNATAYDCCPDYWSLCHGITRRPSPTPFTTLPPRTTRFPSSITRNDCVKDGITFNPGEKLQDNCNECICEVYAGPPRRYEWRCADDVCLIRPSKIDAVNHGGHSWKAANYSSLWGLSLQDGVKYRLGTFPLEVNVVRMTPIRVKLDEVIPESFDARVKWKDLIHPVMDQGNCGASWAFSSTAVASDRLSIESEGAIKDELSPQHMLSCDVDKQLGCEGGYLDRAWWYLRKRGVVTEACYPYTSGQTTKAGDCQIAPRQRQGTCPSGAIYKIEKRYKATPPYRLRPLEREIMKEVMDNGPVQATFQVKEDFYMYKSGVYRYSNLSRDEAPENRLSGYHSVRIIGWGVERTPQGDINKYWICANSWGTDWGENGYFRIARGVNESDIESYVIGAWGKVTGDVRLRRLLQRNRRRRISSGKKFRSLRTCGRKQRRRNGGRCRRHKKKHKKQKKKLFEKL
ncbi:uncharacterized peptidase C1-like protein F26E4.3 [Gigantopelta aegis]|uniref:uncharacterized peptidase C1-like protein F26E4.3 n=1 Tax=Gigantopelta aegis TaxID=1735272 RepID=UPI001B88E2C7|nr:uncharacterized peptidase C1-like protein F26E4.3 [Gigantopelta aegis]